MNDFLSLQSYESFAQIYLIPTLFCAISTSVIYVLFGLFNSFVWRDKWRIALLSPIVFALIGFISGFFSGLFTCKIGFFACFSLFRRFFAHFSTLVLPIAAIYVSVSSSMPGSMAIVLGVFFSILYFIILTLRLI